MKGRIAGEQWSHLISPNGISIGSAVFAGLTNVTNRQTDRPRYSSFSSSPRLM